MAQRDRDHGETPPRAKGLAGAISLLYPPALKKTKTSHLWEPAQPQHSLSNLLAPSPVPLCFSGSSLSSHAGLSPSTAGPLSWKISANPENAISLPVCFVGPQFWQLEKVLFSRKNSAHLVKTCPTPAGDQTLPTISTESLCRKLG